MKKILLSLGLCAIGLHLAQSSKAAGIGIYGTGGVQMMNWTYYSGIMNSTNYYYGGGLIIDSNVAGNKIFNYRFTAGYEQLKLVDPYTKEAGNIHNQISMTHTFGFGSTPIPNIRIWAGPQIGFHYHFADYLYKTSYKGTLYGLAIPRTGVNLKFSGLGFDILLALGINFNMVDIATIFFDMEFGYMGLYNLNDTRQLGHSLGLQAKAGLMLRINDAYKPASTPGDIK